jgi:hypothetical protein
MFYLVMELSPEKKNDGKLCIMRFAQHLMQFPVFFFSGDTPSPNKNLNKLSVEIR